MLINSGYVGDGLFSVFNGGLRNNLRSVDWLLDDLLDNWLLDNLLDNLLSWLVDNLSFNGLIFNSFYNSFLWDIFNNLVEVNLGNIFSLIFNGIVISHLFFLGNVFGGVNWLLDSFVFDFSSFIRNVFNSGFSSDRFSEGLLNNLDGLLNNLNWLLNDLDGLLDESRMLPSGLLDVSDLRSGSGVPLLTNGLLDLGGGSD